MVEHLTFNQVVRGSNPRTLTRTSSKLFVLFFSLSNERYADVAELADALDLGSSVFDVQVQVLSSAV